MNNKLISLSNSSSIPTEFDLLRWAVSSLHNSKKYSPGNCHRNTNEILRLLVESSFNMSNIQVLFVCRPVLSIKLNCSEPNMVMRVRDEGEEFCSFHVILKHTKSGQIIDPSNEKGAVIGPEHEYFKNKFLQRSGVMFGQPDKGSRVQTKFERLSIFEMDRMLTEIYVRTISSNDYVHLIFPLLEKKCHGVEDYWFGMDIPMQNLNDHLSHCKNQRVYPRPSTEEFDPVLGFYIPRERLTNNIDGYRTDTGATFFWDPSKIEYGDSGQAVGAIVYQNSQLEFPVHINRTTRTWEMYDKLLPDLLNIEKLAGKVVLDITTGGGILPEELRARGIVAYGLDLVLSITQKKNVFWDGFLPRSEKIELPNSMATNIFIAGDALKPKIADNQTDVIFDIYGIYEYYSGKSDECIRDAFKEWTRILKSGGQIIFGPVHDNCKEKVAAFIRSLKGLSDPEFFPTSSDRNVFMVRVCKE
ncbi:MAG: methyltransferase domain-containing protein [Candidatus Margulisiibacteriota bacterium]